ncbi:hypothetical protein CBR_g68722 [Chara braunii]|uniref:Myb-like domain-containing protein n=1 Tax=Chara braunii TaxID=69332 RepID=A0A388K9K3_CHABU|nr:hypothetical protein CBR_g68722 [Chara braunii]|eukprot:GBG66738.1 hypothetical protein CBR_g68722 [Chara braunii]
MADMVRTLALLIIPLGAVVLFIALHACHLAGARIRRGRRKGLRRLRQGASASKGMGDEYSRGCEGFGMGRGAYGGGSGMQHNVHHRFDPNSYSHLPPHQQPLPDDTTWTPPPSTLGLAWGSTQTSYDTPPRVESTGGGVGPMSGLLGETRGRGRHPFDLQLSPTTTMGMSRMVLVQRSGQGGGARTQTMHASDLDDGMPMHRPNHMSRPAPSQAAPAGSVSYHQPPAGATMQDHRPDVGGVAESPRCVECIVYRFNSLRATSDGDGAGATMQERRPDLGEVAESPRCVERIVCRFNSSRPTSDGDGGGRDGGASEADHVDVKDDDGDDDDEDEAPVKEAASSGTKKQVSKGRGKAKGKDKEGDTNGEGGGSGARGNWSLNESLVLVRCKRDQDDYFANAGTNFARMKMKDQKWMDIAKRMEKEGVRRNREQCMKRWENIFGWGEDAGDGCGSRSSSNGIHGKRKNARQLAFKAVTDVMKTHSAVVAESVDRASKRQCDVLQRQCDIMEKKARTQKRQCEVLDVGQRMLCDALRKIAGHEVRHYEVDAILHVIAALGYADNMLCEVVSYATKVGRAIPNRWEGGVDVLADIVDLLMSNITNEHEERMTVPAEFRSVNEQFVDVRL